MADSAVIKADATPDNHGLDYAWLKVTGVEIIQQLAGDIWTDYNEHDPGVTTLEQLCYALTELSYRAEFPMADLLADGPRGTIDGAVQALFTARRSLSCNPVTVNDYRKLLVDRIPELANAWLTPLPVEAADGFLGLYRIAVFAPGADPCGCEPHLDRDRIGRTVRDVFCANRALCEDVQSVVVLDPVRTIVTATVSIDSTRAAEAILAAILFNTANVFAPVLTRQPLSALVDAGQTATEIFDGPVLRYGFIADEQLQPMAPCIPVSYVARAIARTPGVAGVRNVTVKAGDNPPVTSGNVAVPEDSILVMDTGPGPKGYTIRLLRKGIEVKPDIRKVQSELSRLKAQQARTYPLAAQYERYFGMPKGQLFDLKTYYSIQNQYPAVYGINAQGVPSDATTMRQGQAKQLKGYLLAAEQLLANFLAQLANAKRLFSLAPLSQTYFLQYLNTSVPEVEPILTPDYKSGIDGIVAASDPVLERRGRFLDFLLAMYGEILDAAMLVTQPGRTPSDAELLAQLQTAKLNLLRALVAATRGRGRGFDYRAPIGTRNIAGMLIKCRIQLGLDPMPARLRADLIAEHAVKIVASDAEATIGQPLTGDEEAIRESFKAVAAPARGTDGPTVLQGQSVTDEFLRAAASLENFRAGPLAGGSGLALVCRASADEPWRMVGRFADEARAGAAAAALANVTSALADPTRQLQIVEHILLRSARGTETDDFPYSFTISAVVVASFGLVRDPDYQAAVQQVVRANAPAAAQVAYCFLNPAQGLLFDIVYGAWQLALYSRIPAAIEAASILLRDFLAANRSLAPDDA